MQYTNLVTVPDAQLLLPGQSIRDAKWTQGTHRKKPSNMTLGSIGPTLRHTAATTLVTTAATTAVTTAPSTSATTSAAVHWL